MALPATGIDDSFHANLHIVGLGSTNSFVVKNTDVGTNLLYTNIVAPLRIESIAGADNSAVYQIQDAHHMTLRGVPNNLITIQFLKGDGSAIPASNLGAFSINLEFEELCG